MASAQVLPNSAASSRKHLEAGKKRLEEFRKKKAAKKAASTGQLISGDADPQNFEHVNHHTDADPSVSVTVHHNEASSSSQNTDIGSSNGTQATLPNSDQALYGDSPQNIGKKVPKLYASSGYSELANGHYDEWKKNDESTHNAEPKFEPADSSMTERHNAFDSLQANPNLDSFQSFHSYIKPQAVEDKDYSKAHVSDPQIFGDYGVSAAEESVSVSVHNRLGTASPSANSSGIQEGTATGMGQFRHGSNAYDSALGSDNGGRKIADSIKRHLNVETAYWPASESLSRDSSLVFKSSQYQHPFPSTGYGTNSGRSRPSFLDSLGVSRVPSASNFSYGEPEKVNQPVSFDDSKIKSMETQSYSLEQPFTDPNTVQPSFMSGTPDYIGEKVSSFSSSTILNDGELPKQWAEDNHSKKEPEVLTVKKDEDFAALEQHIEDLTQEKFSLQRALDTAQSLAESLAAENSSLTDSYNQQGQVVNQLKSDMERLQEEIKGQLLALESFKLEYANAQLECNAADERAKILASEVIGLEEKALRLRSNELKLGKQVENLVSEITSYKRKVSILEKERHDFQSTIDALQEEKKLLQSKLRKASSSGNVNEAKKSTSERIDASTSTDDLGDEHLNSADPVTSAAGTMINSTSDALRDDRPPIVMSSDTSNFTLTSENTRYLPESSSDIPNDQLRMIDNINSLISELAVEKEELLRALTVESANCSKLKDLNKDLSQKLEAQTQRLELLTAQRMANNSMLPKPLGINSTRDTTDYTDEGDEVVERVLGWIMKLFPGGPSKRRTSKLL